MAAAASAAAMPTAAAAVAADNVSEGRARFLLAQTQRAVHTRQAINCRKQLLKELDPKLVDCQQQLLTAEHTATEKLKALSKMVEGENGTQPHSKLISCINQLRNHREAVMVSVFSGGEIGPRRIFEKST